MTEKERLSQLEEVVSEMTLALLFVPISTGNFKFKRSSY
jgi:hypothetical protein